MNPIFLLFLFLLVGKNQGDCVDDCREERNDSCGIHDGMDDCCDCIVERQYENERRKDAYHGSFLDVISLNKGRKEMGQGYREEMSGVSTIAREVLRPVPPPDMIELSSCDCEK